MSGHTDYTKTLESYLKKSGIKAQIVEAAQGGTAVQAAESLGRPIESIVKSILFIDDSGEPVLVILRAANKVRQGQFARDIGRKRVRLATREEVLQHTGYPAGGVPPFGVRAGLEVRYDNKIPKGRVYAGGGSEHHLLLFDSAELEAAYPGRGMDIPVL